ncbi:tubulin-tyrosine ligase [Ceratocystis lukuohia]|uniref:Tubulin-tyrosine ligase n=1 Tax=Ceratocystis lukuohia TaxID=2019550 RepID=A0ABR4MIP1_9PEZI
MIELLMISSATSEEQANLLSQATSPPLSSLTLAKSLSRDPLLLKSRRPALIPHQDPLVAMFKRILSLPWYAMSNSRSRIIIETTLVERVQFPSRAQLPKAMFVDIQAGQSIQTYSASIKFVARMHGLRYLMYHYRALCYVVLTSLFWASSMGFMTVTWFVWVTLIKLSSQEPQSNVDGPKLPQFESRHKSLKDDSLLHSQIKQEAEDCEYGTFTETHKFSNDALQDKMEKDEKKHGPVNIKTESDDEGRRGSTWKDKNKTRNAIGRQSHELEVHQMAQSPNTEVTGTSSGWSSNDDSSAVRYRSQHNI